MLVVPLITAAPLAPIVVGSTVTRSFSSPTVAPGAEIKVQLTVNEVGIEGAYIIDETVPVGWTIVNAGGLTQDGNLLSITIVDGLDPKVPVQNISYGYIVRAPQKAAVYPFSGTYIFESMQTSVPIAGATQVTVQAPAPLVEPAPVPAPDPVPALVLKPATTSCQKNAECQAGLVCRGSIDEVGHPELFTCQELGGDGLACDENADCIQQLGFICLNDACTIPPPNVEAEPPVPPAPVLKPSTTSCQKNEECQAGLVCRGSIDEVGHPELFTCQEAGGDGLACDEDADCMQQLGFMCLKDACTIPPPPIPAAACANENTRADSNCDGAISMPEIASYVQKWVGGDESITMPDVANAVTVWIHQG